ncbi:unnamed protein product [Pseudo-nitzschia multistriata]|uniref:Uncharacterized protein n=1 Tax=Pseudo-nitzschia multistriata TaxID=183589 RepID=A0A448YZL9_9STRA|nr:unnamed protein product [Pseudo-nitzschia multistriata]
MTTIVPDTSEYCDAAKESICENYEENSCCCKSTFDDWQKCLIEEDASVAVGRVFDPCKGTCPPPPPKSKCDAEGTAFVQCRALDSDGYCAACPSVDVSTLKMDFPDALQQQFMSTMATTSPSDPGFCGIAQDGICSDYENNTCCCEPEFSAWQSCLVEKDFSPKTGVAVPCTVSCQAKKGGGGSTTIIVVIVVLLILAAGVGGGGFCYVRKRRAAMNMKGGHDLKKKNKRGNGKNNNKKKGGRFSFGRKKGDEGTENSRDKGEDIYDDEYDGDDYQNRSPRNGKRNSRTPNSKKRNDRNRRKMGSFNGSDIENGGHPTDLSLSESEAGDLRSEAPSRRSSRRGKSFEDEDSISNDYGHGSRDKFSDRDTRDSSSRSKRYLKEKKRSIENNRPVKSYQSVASDDDDVSRLDNSRNFDKRADRSSSSPDLPSKIRSSKKISSRELKKIMKENHESSRRLTAIEDEVADYERELAKRDEEAERLHQEREEQSRRIKELEAKNDRLKQKAGGKKSKSGRNLDRNVSERSERTGGNSHDDYGDNISEYSNRGKGKRNSSRRVGMDYYEENDDDNDDEDDDESYNNYNNSRRGSVSRSSRSKASMREDPSGNVSYRESRGSSRTRPERSRSKSGRTLERAGSRRPQSRSPSSTRSLGKQASSLRQEASRRDSIRRSMSDRGDTARKARSKSPRSYLRDDDY